MRPIRGMSILITGGGEPRRRLLDWGLFHVEHAFLPIWRRYARALKQRNQLLKARARDAQLDAWDHELSEAGEPLTRFRQGYLDRLAPHLVHMAGELVPSLGEARLAFLPGWNRDAMSLADALLVARDRDLANGYTTVGPHRADWRIEHAALPGREALSRGQGKLTALSLLLAQAGMPESSPLSHLSRKRESGSMVPFCCLVRLPMVVLFWRPRLWEQTWLISALHSSAPMKPGRLKNTNRPLPNFLVKTLSIPTCLRVFTETI